MKQLDALLALPTALTSTNTNNAANVLFELSYAWDKVKGQEHMAELIASHDARDFTQELAALVAPMLGADGLCHYDKLSVTSEQLAASRAAIAGTAAETEVSIAAALYRVAVARDYNDSSLIYCGGILESFLECLSLNAEIYFDDDTQE